MTLYERMQKAISINPKIIVDINKLDTAEGTAEWLLADLGLSRNDLKELERNYLAIRGYFPRRATGFLSRSMRMRGKRRGHKRPVESYPKEFFDRKVAPKHSGFEVRWVIVSRPPALSEEKET